MEHETRVAYGELLIELAKENANIVVLDADVSKSTKTIEFKSVAPGRFVSAGIAECNMMGMAAGLAASGKIPLVSSFAVFAVGRAFEIIRNSIAYPNLNVTIIATHAGLSVGEDGASHQSIEDIALMRALPNMRVFVPADYYETKAIIRHAIELDGPCYVRLQRGKSEDIYNEKSLFDFERIKTLREGSDVCIIATGLMVQEALKAVDILKNFDIDPTVVEVSSLKPVDDKGILDVVRRHKFNFTFEEHNIIGGLFSTIAETVAGKNSNVVIPIGIQDEFGESGKPKDVLKKYGLTADHLVKVILSTAR